MIFEKLKRELSKLELLPEEMKRRASYLIKNPRMGRETIGYSQKRDPIKSSCYGTSIWLSGDWAIDECHRISKEIPPVEENSPLFHWSMKSRPGWCESDIIQEFLKRHYEICKNPSSGDLIAISDEDWSEEEWLSHVGIWTGKENIAIVQDGHGGDFEIQDFKKDNMWGAPVYYIRRK